MRRLEYVHPESRKTELHQSIFDEVARTRLRLDILPNMHTLAWKGPLNLSVTFMHAGVKTFEIWLPDELWSSSLQPFFQDVAIRMPNIMNLNIKSDLAVQDFEDDLTDLIHRLPRLRSVTFPRFYTTTKVMEALSRVPNLGVIEFQYFEQGCGDSDDVIPFTPSIEEGAFPALWDLSLSATFRDLARFFGLEFAPTNLTSLYIDSGIIETAASVHKLLCVVADSCQLLTDLSLTSLRLEPMDGDEPYKITFAHLKPVVKMGNLKTLDILHHYPLALKIEDIESLASSWPSLKSLILNNDPPHLLPSELTMEALLPFARHCPKLTHLGLFVDASRIPSVPATIASFKCLQRLSLGTSNIDDDKSAALYLSRVLPSGCSVDFGVTWKEEESPSNMVYKEVFERCKLWEKVGRLVPVLIKLRSEEKERLRVMESEMDDLRMRNDLLSASLKSNASQVMLDKSSCIIL